MRLLDMFCRAGLASWGYWQSGCFSEIVGVDNDKKAQREYAFDFVLGDCMALDYDFIDSFDFIHASPPCQYYSKQTPGTHKLNHERLIARVHTMLYSSGKPYVIENVEGSGIDLKPNIVMNGHYFGLPSSRKRYFHMSTMSTAKKLISTAIGQNIVINGGTASRQEKISAMGLRCIPDRRLRRISTQSIEQGIPPIMATEITRLAGLEKLLLGV